MKSLLLLPLLFASTFFHVTDSRECKPSGNCACKWDDTGKVISLEGINDRNNIKFKNADIMQNGAPTDYQLDYSPCTTFNEGSGTDVCTDDLVCQHNKAKTYYYSAGKPNKFSVNSDGGVVKFTYDGGFQEKYERLTEITLVCKEDANEPIMGTVNEVVDSSFTSSTYKFTLTTNCACESGCKGSSSKGGLSIGSILCIVFLVLLIVYFLGGFLMLKFHKHNEGVETIPQYEFWKDLPAKVKDGFIFTKSKMKKGGEYESI